jgi:hypothetical protein
VTGVQTCALPIFHARQAHIQDDQAEFFLPNRRIRFLGRTHAIRQMPMASQGLGQAVGQERIILNDQYTHGKKERKAMRYGNAKNIHATVSTLCTLPPLR